MTEPKESHFLMLIMDDRKYTHRLADTLSRIGFFQSFKFVSFLWLGSIGGAACAFLTQVILARKLGADDFGLFSSVMAIVLIIVPVAGFGVSQFWLKAFGEEGWSATRWLPSSLLFIILTTALSFLILIVWAYLGPHETYTEKLIIVLSFYLLGQVSIELVSGRFQLEERYVNLAFWQFSPHLLRFFLVGFLALFYVDMGALEAGFAFSAVSFFVFLVGVYFVKSMWFGKLRLKGHGENSNISHGRVNPKLFDIFQAAWPFGLAAFSQLIYYQSDIVFIKYYVGDVEAGIYGVSFTVIAAVYLFPAVLYQKFFLPKLHRWANSSVNKLYEVYRFGNYAMLVFGVLIALLIFVLSEFLIGTLFGEKYLGAVRLLNVLSISVPIIFIAFSVGATLVTRENMRLKVMYMLVVAALNVFLNIIFVPQYGAVGAAYTTVASNAVLLFLYYWGAQKKVFGRSLFDLRKV